MTDYRNNHYVPEWYQHRFISTETKEKKFYYLDLSPEVMVKNGRRYQRKGLLRWGPRSCFCERDLYTTRYGELESIDIEKKFFGRIDYDSQKAVEFFANFKHPSVDSGAFRTFLLYMSLQKMRTPKGLIELSSLIRSSGKNDLLREMQRLQRMYCALWTECVWSIADATGSDTKFIISDHPVTVYNQGCFPRSSWCQQQRDPFIWLSGTHTLFPLNASKILILTNLSWVRNPYDNPTKIRPNPTLFRPAMFNFTQIQTGRKLSSEEVMEINYVIKKRAFRYVAAQEKEWLYPENHLRSTRWNKLGNGYLFMPDPRSVSYSTGTIIGYDDNHAEGFDEFGRRPWDDGYSGRKEGVREDWDSFHAFQGEFARVFGPKRRGNSCQFERIDDTEDSPEFHAYHLAQERVLKAKLSKKRRR